MAEKKKDEHPTPDAAEPAKFNPKNDGPIPPPKNPMAPPRPDTTDDAQKDNRDVNE